MKPNTKTSLGELAEAAGGFEQFSWVSEGRRRLAGKPGKATLLCCISQWIRDPFVLIQKQSRSRIELCLNASLAQLVEHALRKRMVVGSIPTGGSITALTPALHVSRVSGHTSD